MWSNTCQQICQIKRDISEFSALETAEGSARKSPIQALTSSTCTLSMAVTMIGVSDVLAEKEAIIGEFPIIPRTAKSDVLNGGGGGPPPVSCFLCFADFFFAVKKLAYLIFL